MPLIRVATTGDVPTGEGRVVDAAGKSIALFNVEGAFYATDNLCPHRGGPLGDGDLEGTVVLSRGTPGGGTSPRAPTPSTPR